MEKQWFIQQTENIEVPKDDVLAAIQSGMAAGKKLKVKKSRRKLSTLIGTSAATLILASGFVFTPVNNVLAAVPLIGSIYEKLDLGIGKDLFTKSLVTSLNQAVTDNGVKVTLTSAYYDGNIIGITFKAEGNKLSLKNSDDNYGPESGYGHYLFNGDEQKQWESSMAGLKQTKDGLIGAMEFVYPYKKLPKNFTLPITFTSMAGTNGTWKFDVPVKQIAAVNIPVNTEGTTKDHAYTVKITNIIRGKATTTIDFESIQPLIGKDDLITLYAYDDKGKGLGLRSIGPIPNKSGKYSNVNDKTVSIQERANYGEIKDGTKYLMIYPTISKNEFDTRNPIQSTPFDITSERFGYKMVVNKIEKKGNQLIVDYQIANVDAKKFKTAIFKNFADQIKLIRSEDVVKSNDGQAQYEALKGDSLIYGNNGKILIKNDLSFESHFTVDDTFNIKDYSLMVPFGIFSKKDKIEMDPIKVNLTK